MAKVAVLGASLLLLFGAASVAAPVVGVSAIPARPYIEQRGDSRSVNADLIVHNDGAMALKLAVIREQLFDAHGKLELEREVNANGNPPALAAMGDPVVPAHGIADFYQPFDRYDAALDLSRIRLTLVFLEAGKPVPPVALTGDAIAMIDLYPRRFQPASYCLPLAGRLLVHDGHDFPSHHRRRNLAAAFASDPATALNANLYAYDFVRIDEQGRLYHGDMDRKENWLTFGALVRAPTSGTIVAAVDGVPDNSLSAGQPVIPPAAQAIDPGGFGNHVVLRGEDGRVSWLLHMAAGSIRVHSGQHVERGDALGRIGFSGDALFPHLHYTVTSGVTYPAQGVPSYFGHFARLLGTRRIKVGYGQIDTGDIVAAEAHGRCS